MLLYQVQGDNNSESKGNGLAKKTCETQYHAQTDLPDKGRAF